MAGRNNPTGEDIVSKEDCLKCAAEKTNTCGYTYSLLRFLYRDQPDRSGIHVTDLTGCLRRAYFSKTREVIQYPHEFLVLALGSITHAFLEGNDDVIDTEVKLDAMGVTGTTDVMHHNGREFGPMDLTDLKTTRWLKVSNLPYGSHDLQVNIYSALLREMGFPVEGGSIQYIDLSGPTKCRKCKVTVVPEVVEYEEGTETRLETFLHCPSCGDRPNGAHLGAVEFPVEMQDEDEIKSLVEERRDILNLSLEMDDRPEAEPGFLCSYCKFVDECPEGEQKLNEIRGGRRR
jgi:hypothetical protein